MSDCICGVTAPARVVAAAADMRTSWLLSEAVAAWAVEAWACACACTIPCMIAGSLVMIDCFREFRFATAACTAVSLPALEPLSCCTVCCIKASAAA